MGYKTVESHRRRRFHDHPSFCFSSQLLVVFRILLEESVLALGSLAIGRIFPTEQAALRSIEVGGSEDCCCQIAARRDNTQGNADATPLRSQVAEDHYY